jgi:hypothetical protein
VALVIAMAASIQFYARWRRLRSEKEAETARMAAVMVSEAEGSGAAG